MADNAQNPIEQLHQLNHSVINHLHQAAIQVSAINDLIQQLATAELMPETMLLSIVLYDGSNHPSPDLYGGMVLQAALSIPRGIGAVWWTAEEFAEHRNHPPPNPKELLVRFVPFDSCETGIKVLLVPHVYPLLGLLHDSLARLRRNRN